MINPIQQLLTPPGLNATAFPPNSRYHGIEIKAAISETGETMVYLKRRFVPPPASFALLQFHTVVQGDQLDNLAHKYLGDPEQFWRLCDANGAMRPKILTDIGVVGCVLPYPKGFRPRLEDNDDAEE